MPDPTRHRGRKVFIDVADVFSPFPGPRYRHQGPDSGEAFREDRLIPAILSNADSREPVVVDLSGARYGAPIGWLEEVFGGLVRKLGPDAPNLIEVTGVDDATKSDIEEAMENAAAAHAARRPAAQADSSA